MTAQVSIWTDGACSGNPGPGGWGAILRYGDREKDLCGGELYLGEGEAGFVLVGVDRVLFGSDYPLILYPRDQRVPEFKRFLNDVVTAGLTIEEQEKVLGKNLLRLVGREYDRFFVPQR